MLYCFGKYYIGGIHLKAIMRAIDKFCLQHRRFGIPRLMLVIVIGSAAVFLLTAANTSLFYLLNFDPSRILHGEVWRLVTWVFYPAAGGSTLASSIFFTAIMLYFYYFIGSTLEREWGMAKFNVYYILGVLLHVVFAFIVWAVSGTTVFLTSGFLNLSMFFAFAVLYPDQRVLLFFVIPIKIKWLALLNAGFFLFSIISSLINADYYAVIVPVAALLNFLIFCGEDLMRYLRPYRARSSPSAINFRKAARKVKQEQAAKPYRHKCSVCGRTDTDHPELEFRYCSRCEGYHAFCNEHINNHVHFK